VDHWVVVVVVVGEREDEGRAAVVLEHLRDRGVVGGWVDSLGSPARMTSARIAARSWSGVAWIPW
jgi:hypothetical protein